MAHVPGAKATERRCHAGGGSAGIVVTFNIVCLGWLMFRAESMQTVSLMLHQIFENFNAAMIPQVVTGYAAVFALIAAGYILHLLPVRATPCAADRDPVAAGSAGPDGRGDDLVRHADQIQRHTAVYLFPVLMRIWTLPM